MDKAFTFFEFIRQFPNDDACLEEIKRLRFPNGTRCLRCKRVTKYFKVRGRLVYSCEFCRNQIYPLATTLFEKSSTPLRVWFYCIFLMTHTRANISITQLQKELGVTYKTAWRMYVSIRALMAQNNGDLLSDAESYTWTFFKKIQFTLVEKKESA